MAKVNDVAAYILEHAGPLTAMKLQKLVYYSQAWQLVWEDKALFPERIEAWANGPVSPTLFDLHRGKFSLEKPWPCGDPSNLTSDEKETIDVILESYGTRSARELSALSHAEDPWRNAREGLLPTAISNVEITHEAMFNYYSQVDRSEDAKDLNDWELEPFDCERF